jgi:Mg2+-importing ATPase
MPAGLTDAEAAERLARDGPNEPVTRVSWSLPREIVRRIASPLVAILVLSSLASAVLGDLADAGVILVIVALSIGIELVQTHRAQRAAVKLASAVAATATVMRDGEWREIPRRAVVVGDVVRLTAGDMIAADGRVLEAKDLHLNEAALTGESLPVEKSAGGSMSMGSSVISGTGTAVVAATGPRTAFGEIARALAERAGPTELERGMAAFGGLIGRTVVFLVLFVLAAAAALHRDPLQSFLFAVALAVGLTPEFLPMITTVTLARGAVRMARAHVVVKNLAAIQSFGSMDILCSDKTGTLTTGTTELVSHVDAFGTEARRVYELAAVNSAFETGVPNALDAAILRFSPVDPSTWEKVDEVPFDFERRRVSVVVRRLGRAMLVVKGAPEQLLDVTTQVTTSDGVRPIDDETRARIQTTIHALSGKGLRVVAVASRDLERRASYGKDDERDLVLAGFLGFVDRPREGTMEAVSALRSEGIHVKVLTGDSELVAAYVCDGVGISTKHMLTGRDIDALTDPALAHRALRTDVFARVSPAQKSRILHALKSRGHVVGFLGDGINDAPSIHAADIGISVANATDVAKDAASVILLEPGLHVLFDGVLEGRRAFGNVVKYLLMGTSSSFGNVFSMAVASVVLPFLPMLPQQILLNSFLYDLAQLTIPYDAVEAEFTRKPRRWDFRLVRRFMTWIGPVSSVYDFLTFAVLIRVFHADAAEFRTGWFVESLATQTLVIFVIRTRKSPFRSRPSRPLVATTLAVVATGSALPFTPLAPWFGFVPLPAAFFLFLGPAIVTYLALVEVAKRRLFRHAL